ncbi:MAG: SLBB domain-containing protein [Clostridiales Family XIII bacterium]|jgi:Na+-translocating ferredoxin:NAD+ oxidoreductase RnfC subunit|nr:SLBB domain-containing protein [Clostridiales Family XIII bacterium]
MGIEGFVNKIKDAGVVGAGGAGFPAYMKLGGPAEYVIVNGAECEPLLRVDQQLMADRAADIIEGLSLIAEQTKAKHAVIALKEKYKDAIRALTKALNGRTDIILHTLGAFYPAGDEQVLVYEVTGRIVPEGGIPIAVGCVVCNAETVLNIRDVLQEGKPVTEKYLTVAGEVRQPLSVRVPVGISIEEAIGLAGGAACGDYAVINGGPMMGKVTGKGSVVTKTTKGLIVLPESHPLIVTMTKDMKRMLREARTACMHCSLCTEVCPRKMLGHRIEPHKLIRIASYGSICDARESLTMANLCVECRLCQYACVQDLQPWRVNAMLKKDLKERGVAPDYKAAPAKAHPFREYGRYNVHRLGIQLGIDRYDAPAPFSTCRIRFGKVTIPMSQHIGAPASPCVAKGGRVKAGDIVGAAREEAMGCPVHASIDGVVTEVTEASVVIEAE